MQGIKGEGRTKGGGGGRNVENEGMKRVWSDKNKTNKEDKDRDEVRRRTWCRITEPRIR